MIFVFRDLIPLMSVCLLVGFVHCKSSLLRGVHPLDEKYFFPEVIKCKDGSKSFAKDRLNDNFCDCIDGTDEPGTSACPAGKFYCRNVGSTPRFIFSSHVNDHICDCCDGSDEYDGSIKCPNTCIMGGNIEYKREFYDSTISDLGSVDERETKNRVNMDFIQKLKGLKVIIVLQVVFISLLVVLPIIFRRVRSKRRRYRGRNQLPVHCFVFGFLWYTSGWIFSI